MNNIIKPLINSLCERIAAEGDLAERDLLKLARPSLRLATRRVTHEEVGVGQSRIGGVPDVPLGFEWPHWAPSKHQNRKYGRPWHPNKPTPLGFIAQIDLSTVPQVDDTFASSGWLYFFYDRYSEPWGFDPDDRGCCHIIHVNCDRASLVRMEPPPHSDPEHVAYPCLLETWPELTLPDDYPEIEYGTSTYEAYRRLRDDLAGDGDPIRHRLLGYPDLIQNPMELECQLASNGVYCVDEAKGLESGAVDWRLLLQIDTDEDGPGWMWGDCGRIYFWVRKQDLCALQFVDAWLVLQCS